MCIVDIAGHTRVLCIAHYQNEHKIEIHHLVNVWLGQQPIKEGTGV